jgi:hypothetical protein
VVVGGLAAIIIIFGVAVARFNKAGEVATAVGSVSGVIAAIIGSYFGLRGSTVAQAQVIEMMSQPNPPSGSQEPKAGTKNPVLEDTSPTSADAADPSTTGVTAAEITSPPGETQLRPGVEDPPQAS